MFPGESQFAGLCKIELAKILPEPIFYIEFKKLQVKVQKNVIFNYKLIILSLKPK